MIGPRNRQYLCTIPTDLKSVFGNCFLKLLRSPAKDCPRFKALMTETFESGPYQSFLRSHQVRPIPICSILGRVCDNYQNHISFLMIMEKKKNRWLSLASGLLNLNVFFF